MRNISILFVLYLILLLFKTRVGKLVNRKMKQMAKEKLINPFENQRFLKMVKI